MISLCGVLRFAASAALPLMSGNGSALKPKPELGVRAKTSYSEIMGTARQWIKALVPLALFIGLGVFLAGGLTRDPSVLPSELIDRPVPMFEMQTLSGETIDQTALEGEVTLLNIFGSWCVACLVEHPVLMELQKSSNVRLVGVNWRDQRDKARAWLDRHGDPYDAIIFDPESRLVIELGVAGAPETFLLDQSGHIRYKHTGPISEGDWENTLSPIVQKLRDESGSETDQPRL